MAAGLMPDIDFVNDTMPVHDYQNFTSFPEGVTKTLKIRKELSLDQLRTFLLTDPAGMQEVRVDKTLDLTALGAAFITVCTIPAGSKVKMALFQILTTVAVASTGDSLGLGTHAGTPTLLLAGAVNLTKNYQLSKCPSDATGLIAGSTVIDLSATQNSDGSLSSSNITAGKVRVIIVYETPVVLANV